MCKQCIICDRPTSGGFYCREHSLSISKERAAAKRRTREWRTAQLYVRYKGWIVAFWRRGGKLVGDLLLGVRWESVPKARKYDLDSYVVGLNRKQVKRLKARTRAIAGI